MNTSELKEEFILKAQAAGLTVDCAMDGFISSEIAVVAEAPGEQEVRAKVPLVGGSGSFLWTVLRKYGIQRHDCYVTNTSKRQISFDSDDRRSPVSRNEKSMWGELLWWELSQLPNLRIIIALGNLALEALTGHDGITNWRGSVVTISLPSHVSTRPRSVKVICSFNPAAVLRNRKDESIFHMDMARVRRVREGTWREHSIEAITNPSFGQSRDYLRSLRSSDDPIAYDIETMGGETACVGFANNGSRGICINFRTRGEHRFSVDEEMELRREIAALLGDPAAKLIAQNNMFDASWLWYKDRTRVAPIWFDTMLAHHTLYPWMPHDLGFLCTQYTTHPYYKDEGKTWKEGKQTSESVDQFWTYNVKDCCITWLCAQAMLRELEKQELKDFFFNHVMRLQHHLVRMTVGGVKIDLALRESINASLTEELNGIRASFYQAVREATGIEDYFPNPNSPTQLSELLFDKLQLVGRGAKVDDENRDRMFKHPRTSGEARKVLQTLGKYKEEAKFHSTYVETEIDEDGRVRCSYKQTGVSKAPGRLSSSKVLWGHYDLKSKQVIQHGMNLQNQPSRAHAMFIADEGYTFVYADGSQAEARYVGWDAEIEQWMEDFERARLDGKYDAHRSLASVMFKVPYDDVPSTDEEDGRKTIRYIAKRCRHGLNYRMMADRLATTAGLPLSEAQRAFELYHRINPKLRTWWAKLEKTARETRMLFNSYGRRLLIQGPLDDSKTLESIVAFRPQSTIGDKINRVIYLSHDDERWPSDARIALNIHDAVVALVPLGKEELCASIIKKHMEEPIIVRPTLPPLIIPAEIGISVPDEQGVRRWSTIKKVK